MVFFIHYTIKHNFFYLCNSSLKLLNADEISVLFKGMTKNFHWSYNVLSYLSLICFGDTEILSYFEIITGYLLPGRAFLQLCILNLIRVVSIQLRYHKQLYNILFFLFFLICYFSGFHHHHLCGYRFSCRSCTGD